MEDILHALLDRRTIRNFKHKNVKDEDIKMILKCAKYAPSAMNEQPWHFTVVQNKELLENINKGAKQQMLQSEDVDISSKAADPNFDIFYHASTVIIVSANEQKNSALCDCANASLNICLAAYGLGLGSCYNGSFKLAFANDMKNELLEKLNLPTNFKPVFAVAIGYINGSKPIEPTRLDKFNYVK